MAINPQLSSLYLELSLVSLPYCNTIVWPPIAVVPNKVFLTALTSVRKVFSLTLQNKCQFKKIKENARHYPYNTVSPKEGDVHLSRDISIFVNIAHINAKYVERDHHFFQP